MRHDLAKCLGDRATFTASFVRLGAKRGWYGRVEQTVLLRDVTDETGHVIADHAWFNLTAGFAKLLPFVEGECIQFDARVKTYEKGYQGRRAEEIGEAWSEIDYKLARPSRVRRLVTASLAAPHGGDSSECA